MYNRVILVFTLNEKYNSLIKNTLITYISLAEFPEEDNSSIKAAITGAAKLGIFPVCVLNISNTCGTAELLLCYNEFGVFVNENGRRTRAVDPVWNHLPFAFGTIIII